MSDDSGNALVTVDFMLYATLSSMRRGIRRVLDNPDIRELKNGNDTCETSLAYAVQFNPDRKGEHYALLFFNKEHFGAGVVAHELTHLLLWAEEGNLRELAKRKRWSRRKSDLHEIIAVSMEQMTREFWNWYYDEK